MVEGRVRNESFLFPDMLCMKWVFKKNLLRPKSGHATSATVRGTQRCGGAGSCRNGRRQNCSLRKAAYLKPSKAPKKQCLNEHALFRRDEQNQHRDNTNINIETKLTESKTRTYCGQVGSGRPAEWPGGVGQDWVQTELFAQEAKVLRTPLQHRRKNYSTYS